MESEFKKPTKVKIIKKDSDEEEPEKPAWNNEQQKQMEQGMKDVPASVPTKERWVKIAEMVDGKSAKECYERFKEIVAKIKNK